MSDKVDTILVDLKHTMQQELSDLKNMRFFRTEELANLDVLIRNREKNIVNLQEVIIDNCKHEWELDFIDSMEGYKLSQPIKYCKKCELTDNTV